MKANLPILVSGALLALSLAAGSAVARAKDLTLLNVSYDPTRDQLAAPSGFASQLG
jgi:ABC-type sulfate transport system substrate-binding protein